MRDRIRSDKIGTRCEIEEIKSGYNRKTEWNQHIKIITKNKPMVLAKHYTKLQDISTILKWQRFNYENYKFNTVKKL